MQVQGMNLPLKLQQKILRLDFRPTVPIYKKQAAADARTSTATLGATPPAQSGCAVIFSSRHGRLPVAAKSFGQHVGNENDEQATNNMNQYPNKDLFHRHHLPRRGGFCPVAAL